MLRGEGVCLRAPPVQYAVETAAFLMQTQHIVDQQSASLLTGLTWFTR